MTPPRILLITGVPGVGKTTLIKRLASALQAKSQHSCAQIQGFFTTEVRDATGRRVGFDAVTLDGQTAPLARLAHSNNRALRVGRYEVLLPEFERLVLPLLQPQAGVVFVIDEIGKMELLSTQFAQRITALLDCPAVSCVIATIPVAAKALPVVDSIRRRADVQVTTLTAESRDSALHHVLAVLAGTRLLTD